MLTSSSNSNIKARKGIDIKHDGTKESMDLITSSVGPGWKSLVTNLVNEIREKGWDGNLFQIKEKFGGLRFYIGEASSDIHDAITCAETESYHICETCGDPGVCSSEPDGRWLRTLCQNCRDTFPIGNNREPQVQSVE
jgi:hypothetical protein